ncbi:hypothetical protein B0T14DRAFT_509030 [Immersiella caudata]|uniref:Uncharacterized protein n=1 Tax=Immersiella caudata TaxID=314043 RepID=A0AA39X2H7_9PEZI|nr:hypothetical protein B0T14DRAFT_509030 [Immersiella caudata]
MVLFLTPPRLLSLFLSIPNTYICYPLPSPPQARGASCEVGDSMSQLWAPTTARLPRSSARRISNGKLGRSRTPADHRRPPTPSTPTHHGSCGLQPPSNGLEFLNINSRNSHPAYSSGKT